MNFHKYCFTHCCKIHNIYSYKSSGLQLHLLGVVSLSVKH